MELGWRNRGGTVFASGMLVSILRTLTLSLFFADVGGVGERVGESWLRVRAQHGVWGQRENLKQGQGQSISCGNLMQLFLLQYQCTMPDRPGCLLLRQ